MPQSPVPVDNLAVRYSINGRHDHANHRAVEHGVVVTSRGQRCRHFVAGTKPNQGTCFPLLFEDRIGYAGNHRPEPERVSQEHRRRALHNLRIKRVLSPRQR